MVTSSSQMTLHFGTSPLMLRICLDSLMKHLKMYFYTEKESIRTTCRAGACCRTVVHWSLQGLQRLLLLPPRVQKKETGMHLRPLHRIVPAIIEVSRNASQHVNTSITESSFSVINFNSTYAAHMKQATRLRWDVGRVFIESDQLTSASHTQLISSLTSCYIAGYHLRLSNPLLSREWFYEIWQNRV